MNPKLCGQHFIGHQWRGEANAFTRNNPQTNTRLEEGFAEAAQQDIDTAAHFAEAAFWAYQAKSPQERANLLDAIAHELELAGDTIIPMAMLESGLGEARLKGELGRTSMQLRLFASVLRQPYTPLLMDNANPERTPLPKPELRLAHLPLGVVAVFGASNFPLAFSTAGGDTASALAAGCAVIVKGHPAHPGTSELVTRAIAAAIEACNMPKGLFSLLQGCQPTLSMALVEHPVIKAVGFTGSLKVGRLLAERCALRPEPIPFFGELGSVNPQVLLPGKLALEPEALAKAQVASMMMGHGQFCTSPGLVLAIRGAGLERYLMTLAETLSAEAPASMLSFGICQNFKHEINHLLDDIDILAQGQAATAVNQSRPLIATTSAEKLLAKPTLFNEVFGPFALVVMCEDSIQLLSVINALPGQLSASLHGLETELDAYGEIAHRLSFKVGRLVFNQMPTGVEVARAMNHGGPFPASTDSRTTSVGTEAMKRFQRPLCLQNLPQQMLPMWLPETSSQLKAF